MGTKTENTISQTVLPSWYTNYAQQILSNQQALSAQPYQAYGGPRVANFNQTQQQGFGMTGQAATAYQPGMAAAGGVLQGMTGRSGLSAATPWYMQAAAINPSASAASSFDASKGALAAGSSALGLNAATPYLQQAAGMSSTAAAMPAAQQAMGLTNASTNALGLQMAQPYLNAAGQSSVANINDYMNPYINSVVDRIGQVGARTLNEQILPGISDAMVGAGQFGGTRQAELMGRALRDTMGEISAQQSNALSSGYTTALGASQADLGRYAGLAGTAGNLGTSQQQALGQAGQQYGTLASMFGNLSQADQSALTNIGQISGNLGTSQQQALLDIARQQAALGNSQAGLDQAQQQFLAGLGTQTGSLYNQDTANQQGLAGALAQYAQQMQQMGLTGANAVTGVGNQQQAQTQKNLDTAYGDYQTQANYAQQQQQALMAALASVNGAVPAATASVSSSKTPNASTLQQLVGGLSAAAGVGSMLGLGAK